VNTIIPVFVNKKKRGERTMTVNENTSPVWNGRWTRPSYTQSIEFICWRYNNTAIRLTLKSW